MLPPITKLAAASARGTLLFLLVISKPSHWILAFDMRSVYSLLPEKIDALLQIPDQRAGGLMIMSCEASDATDEGLLLSNRRLFTIYRGSEPKLTCVYLPFIQHFSALHKIS